MSERPLHEWFNGAQDGQFNKPQRPDYILPRMALTMVDPQHKHALMYCCHQYVAAGIRENMDKLEPDDKIIHFGMGDTVFHTILVRGDQVLLDRAITKEYKGYDPEEGVYRTSRGVEEIVRETTWAEFQEQYLSKINLDDPELPKENAAAAVDTEAEAPAAATTSKSPTPRA